MTTTAVPRASAPPAKSTTDSSADSLALSATTGAATVIALQAAQPLPPRERALEGYRIAAGSVPEGAGAAAQAVADAAGNARAALARTDLPPAQAATLQTVVERLGNEVIDGRIAPQMNNEFRNKLHALASEAPTSDKFRDALTHLHAVARRLDQVALAPGTALVIDPKSGANLSGAGLPSPDVLDLDADNYYKTRDGVLHVESVKDNVKTLAGTVRKSAKGEDLQVTRQAEWLGRGSAELPRQVNLHVVDSAEGFDKLMNDANLHQLQRLTADPSQRNIVLGERAYSFNELTRLNDAATADMHRYVAEARQAHLEAGGSASTFKAPYTEYLAKHMPTPEATMQRQHLSVGRHQPLADLPTAQLPGARQGGLWGGAVTAGLSTAAAVADGHITAEEGRQIALHTAVGAGTGAVTAAGERALTPLLDRAVGQAVQQRAGQAAAYLTPATATSTQRAASVASTGFAARTLAVRTLGASAVGAVVSTGVSAYENRDGLARGDSRAIGNVAADAAVATGSIASATAAGMAIGSVVPGAGTVVGAAVGLTVGVGVAYGAQLSGARDWVADKTAGAVNWVKSWF